MTQLSHEQDMQPSLFERENPPSPSEQFSNVSELSHAIVAAVERKIPVPEIPDATDRHLAEQGGGGRKEHLMQDPPFVRTEQVPVKRLNTRGGKAYPVISDSGADEEWQEGQRNLVEPGSPEAQKNIVEIETLRVSADQRYFDSLQEGVREGYLKQTEADALWRKRIESRAPRSA